MVTFLEVFINILDRIRSNIARKQELDTLNARYFPDFIPRNEDMYITLAPRRDQSVCRYTFCNSIGTRFISLKTRAEKKNGLA